MNNIISLHELQFIDNSIVRITRLLENIQVSLSSDTEGDQLLFLAANLKSSMESLNTEISAVTRQITSRQIKYSQNESALYGGKISNSKELQELQLDNARIKEQIPVFEEQLMILMEKMEDLLNEEGKLTAEIAKHNDLRSTSLVQLSIQAEAYKRELVNYQSQRASLYDNLPSEIKIVYSTLRKAKAGVAVIEVNDDSCGTCGADISKSEIQQAHGGSIVYCQGCGRVIFAR